MPLDAKDSSSDSESLFGASNEGAKSDTGSFELSGESGGRRLTRDQLDRYCATYKKGARQIRRWWKEGAPLDRPEEMPNWWTKGHTWSCPDAILEAAKQAIGARSPGP